MTSDPAPRQRPTGCFVWTWLPGATKPVVAGRLERVGDQLIFNYGRSYLAHPDAMPIFDRELPLQAGALPLLPGLSMPGCLRDASPDAWGRRVIINRTLGLTGAAARNAELDELTYLLESGSDRVGALDFQTSATTYAPRESPGATLNALLRAAADVERGVPLEPDLALALQHGTALGGARPKALLTDGPRKLIAKFSASNDLYSVVKAEFVAMRLAAACGLDVASVHLTNALGKDVLLVERFDRTRTATGDWTRRGLVSALTLLELDELMAAHASYQDLAEIVRHRFAAPKASLRELFARLVFNVLCGNTDDHARNHAAFWDGVQLRLTPAYDICPQLRSGGEATQAMRIEGADRRSQLRTCLAAVEHFLLTPADATAIIRRQVATIRALWDATCDAAGLSDADRGLFWNRQFLNPYAFEGVEDLQA